MEHPENDFPNIRAELPALARALGLEAKRDRLDGYEIHRDGRMLLYHSTPQQAKAFLRGYQHGKEAQVPA